MEGVLWKWTNYWNGWQTRWFVLENSVLAYYKSQDEVNQGCKGSIKVSAAEIIAHPGGEGTRMDIVVPGEQHFYLRAPSFKERQQWLVALGSAKQSNTIGDGPPPVPLSLVLGSGDAADARRESLAARAALRRRTSSSSSSNAVVPSVNDAQSVYAALRSRRGELRLYCDLIIQQVHEIQAVSSFIKDNQNAISDGSAKPHLERMHEAASVLGPTCDSFVEALEECLETVSPSMHQPPSSRSNHSSEH
ncbi:pleckstrin homology domain-containing family A member 3-like isoform X1 [Ischnura elegans]|uniref:pleckstrin homology domain-containing family A member 3-like isoform X1 n=1 Tax=Ischnura elegans TaxID=197161 RepID=UPI001ED86858|nr:pleckstrin homology domain-containing family A member 3-like isoform X1 [Ischnura elegans]